MEPINCLADIRADRGEIRGPMQDPGGLQDLVAEVTGLEPLRDGISKAQRHSSRRTGCRARPASVRA